MWSALCVLRVYIISFFLLFDIVLLRIIPTISFFILIVFHLDIFVIICTYFFVKPEKTVYEVLEGEEIVIPITTSVPVECIGSIAVIRQRCTQTIKIAQPVYQGNPSEKCINNIQEENMVFNTQECGVTFYTNNWEMPVNLIVTGYIDNVYNTNDRTGHIRLKIEEGSSIDLSGVWDTVNIPDIQVRLHSFISQFKPKPNCTELETHLKKSRQQNYPYHHPMASLLTWSVENRSFDPCRGKP